MVLNNPPKLYGIIAAMIVLGALAIAGKLDQAGFVGLMGMIIGYLVGNGVAAKRDEPVEPVMVSRRSSEEGDETRPG